MQDRQDGRVKAELGAFHLPAAVFQKVLDQAGNVGPAVAQGGQGHRHHVEPVVQILPKTAGLHGLLKVAVGGGQNPDIDPNLTRSSQPLKLALLENAQQFDLEIRRQVTDLVQKNSPPVGQLKLALFLAGRPGKGAPLMAEQLVFEQLGRQRRAVDGNKRMVDPRAPLVDGPGQHLFAGAALAQQQHG